MKKAGLIFCILWGLLFQDKTKAQSCFIAPTSTFNCVLNLATTNYSISFATGPYTVVVTNSSNTSTLATVFTSANTGTLANLPIGVYNVVLITSTCTYTNPYTVVNPFSSSGAVITTTNVTCNGVANGQAFVLPSNNFTPPISYTWSNGSNNQFSGNIGAGTHSVIVKDVNNCTFTTNVNITEPSLITSTTINTLIPCFGGTTTAVITSTGGLAPFNYSVNSSAIIGNTANNISVGVVTITTKDSYSCVVNNTVNIIQSPQPIILNSITPATCPGKADASATVTINNAPPPYSYTWQPNGSVTTPQINNIPIGNYTITVKDASACITKSIVNITALNALTVSPIITPENCSATDGATTIQVNGGTPPFQYTLFPVGTVSNTVTNLSSGNYTLIVLDANNCKDSSNLFIGNLSTVSVSVSSFTPILCYNNCNGAVNLTIQNAVLPVTYSVSGTGTTTVNPIENLCAGFKIIKVIDSMGCPATTTLNLIQPPVFSFSASVPQTICIGQSTSIQAYASGGAGNYNYVWQPGNLNGQLISVSPLNTTTYSLNVYDANACTLPSFQVTVNVNPPLTISTNSVGNGICPGTTTQISPIVLGGNGNYTYNWLPGNITTASIFVENVSVPIYTLEVTDGCGTPKATNTISINLLPKIIPTFNVTKQFGCQPLCISFTNTTAKSYNEIWNFGDKPLELTGNSVSYCYDEAGLYNVKLSIKDSNNCKTNFTYTSFINVYPKPSMLIETEPKNINLLNAENVILTAVGNAQNYFWLNDNNKTIGNQTNYYTSFQEIECKLFKLIGVTDKACKDTISKTICVNNPLTVWVPNAITPNNDGLNDELKPVGTGWQEGSYSFEIYNRWGQKIFKTTNPDESWKAHGNSDNSDMRNIYYWKIIVNDDIDGTEKVFKGFVTVVR